MSDEIDDEIDDVVEETPPAPSRPKHIIQPKPIAKRTTKLSVQPELAEPVVAEVEPVVAEVKGDKVDTDADSLLRQLFDAVSGGGSVVITKTGESTYTVSATGKAGRAGRAGRPAKRGSKTKEYLEFEAEWKALSYEEKVRKAEEAGVEWERHSDPRVDNMRLTMAYRDAMGVAKYED